jgi:histidinol phosphatase-like enzyme
MTAHNSSLKYVVENRTGDGSMHFPKQQFDQLFENITTSLASFRITDKEVLATLPESRQRVYARRYGKASRIC